MNSTIKEHYNRLKKNDHAAFVRFNSELFEYDLYENFRQRVLINDKYDLRKMPVMIALLIKKHLQFDDVHFLENVVPTLPVEKLPEGEEEQVVVKKKRKAKRVAVRS